MVEALIRLAYHADSNSPLFRTRARAENRSKKPNGWGDDPFSDLPAAAKACLTCKAYDAISRPCALVLRSATVSVEDVPANLRSSFSMWLACAPTRALMDSRNSVVDCVFSPTVSLYFFR